MDDHKVCISHADTMKVESQKNIRSQIIFLYFNAQLSPYVRCTYTVRTPVGGFMTHLTCPVSFEFTQDMQTRDFGYVCSVLDFTETLQTKYFDSNQ